MINCDQALELISASLDVSLTPAEQQALDSHLADCPACRALLADFQKMNDVFSTLPAAPPASLSQGVMDRIAAQKAEEVPKVTAFPRKTAQRWVRWGAAAAVFAVVILGAGRAGVLDVLVSRNEGAALPAVSDAADAGNSSRATGRSSDGGGTDADVIQDPEVPQSNGGDSAASAEDEVPDTAALTTEAPSTVPTTPAATEQAVDPGSFSDAASQPESAPTVSDTQAATGETGKNQVTTALTMGVPVSLTQEEARQCLIAWLEEHTDSAPEVIGLGLSSDGGSWLFACQAADGILHYAVPRDGGAITTLDDLES